jgi:hypothetical protein
VPIALEPPKGVPPFLDLYRKPSVAIFVTSSLLIKKSYLYIFNKSLKVGPSYKVVGLTDNDT